MKKLILIITFMLAWGDLFSQSSQTFLWGVKAGGKGTDRIADITSIGDNIYVTGQFNNSFISGNESSLQGNENGIFLFRLDKNGHTDWMHTLTGNMENKASRIKAVGENFLLSGICSGPVYADKSSFVGSGKALFISLWNEKGKTAWFSRLPFSGYATLDVLENTQQGKIIAGGMFQGIMKTEGIEMNLPSERRAYLITLSDNGKPENVLFSTGKGSHRLISMTIAPDGNRFLLFSITGDFGFGGIPVVETPKNMDNGLVLVKTTSSGEPTWVKLFPGTGYLEGIKILAMQTGDVFMCANYANSIRINDTTLNAKGNIETACLLFSPEGILKKAKIVSSPAAVRALDAMLARNGNPLITGYFRQEYSTENEQVKSKSSLGDLFLLQLDKNLDIVWHDEPGQDAASFSKAFTIDKTGNIILAGAFSGELNLRNKKLISDGSNDILVAKYYNCLQKKADITGNPFLCEGGNTVLSVTGDYSTYLWNGQWNKSSLSVDRPGQYVVMAYDRTGCAATDTIEVKVLPEDDLGLPDEVTVYPSQSVSLKLADGFNSYLWSDGITSPQREITYTTSVRQSELSVTAISSSGCITTDTVRLKFASAFDREFNAGGLVSVWPNPVDHILSWSASFDGIEGVSVSLVDENGEIVYSQKYKNYIKGSVQNIDMSRMVGGHYLLTLRSGELVFTRKIVKK